MENGVSTRNTGISTGKIYSLTRALKCKSCKIRFEFFVIFGI